MSVNSKLTAIADEIRVKTGKTDALTLDQMAESISQVYTTGQKSMVDESKLIPKTVSGSYISVDDVSEVPHNVRCKVESVNLFDKPTLEAEGTLNGLSWTLNEDKSVTINGTATKTTVLYYQNKYIDLGTYTLSGCPSSMKGSVYLQTNKFINGTGVAAATSGVAPKTFEISDDDTLTATFIGILANTTLNNVTVYPMLNRGDTSLPYTPYISPGSVSVTKYGVDENEGYQILTPATDGTVEGMTSVSPHMNIFSDTEGVNIEATYNKSWGIQTEYDRFWDDFQDYGNRTSCRGMFAGAGWNVNTFNPKYKTTPKSITAIFMFHFCNYGNTPLLDYRNYKHLFDFSNVTNATSMFQDAWIDYINIDLSNATNLSNAFYEGYSAGRKTHITLTVSEKCTTFSSAFAYCTALTDLVFTDGSVIAANINLKDSPLNKVSITSIINALSATATSKTVTFKKSAKEVTFTDGEWSELTATKPNWTFALV